MMARPEGASSRPLCSDCNLAPACVSCCSVLLCLLHAHCTRHSVHPSMWTVVDKAEYDASAASVDAVRRRVIAQLEKDLNALTDSMEQSFAATAASNTPSSPPAPASVPISVPVPPRPTFNDVRNATVSRATVASNASSTASTGKRPRVATAEESDDDATARRSALPTNVFATVARSAEQREMSKHAAPPPPVASVIVEKALPPVTVPATEGGDIRSRVVSTLASSLSAGNAHDVAALSGGAGDAAVLQPAALRTLASAVEAALLAECGSDDHASYRQRARELIDALRSTSNTACALRGQLVAGELAPSQYASLPADAFLGTQEAAERSTIRAAALAAVDDSLLWTAAPGAYTCPHCASTDAEYMPVAARADSRKAEIWGFAGEDTRVRVRCTRCGSSWMRDSL